MKDTERTRREFLAAAGVAGLTASAGCVIPTPFDTESASATVTEYCVTALCEAFSVVETTGAGTVGGPEVTLAVAEAYRDRLDYVVHIQDGKQIDYGALGVGETKVELYVDEGENRVLGVSGGYAENGEVLGGDTVIEATVTVEVKS